MIFFEGAFADPRYLDTRDDSTAMLQTRGLAITCPRTMRDFRCEEGQEIKCVVLYPYKHADVLNSQTSCMNMLHGDLA